MRRTQEKEHDAFRRLRTPAAAPYRFRPQRHKSTQQRLNIGTRLQQWFEAIESAAVGSERWQHGAFVSVQGSRLSTHN